MNQASPWLSVVIPAYNEGRRVAQSLAMVRDYLQSTSWSWEILLVDDGSKDQTANLAEEAAAGDSRIRILRCPHRGKGGAVRAGMLEARGEFRLMCDCDQSTPIAQLAAFLPPALNDFDLAIASRGAPGARRVGEPIRRNVLGRVFNVLVRATLVKGISDTQCGFKVFRAAAAESLFRQMTIEGWAFDVELLHLAQVSGLRLIELPVEWRYADSSSVRIIRDASRMFLDVTRMSLRARRRR